MSRESTTTPTRAASVRKWFEVARVALFALALASPLVDRFARDDEARSPLPELRFPAPKPELRFTARELSRFPRRYEAWWNDRFGLRDVLLRWNSIVHVFGFGVAPSTGYVLGRERWIFYVGGGIRESCLGRHPFDEAELERWRRRLVERRRAVEASGAHYLFVPVPEKPSIYPDYMPPRWRPVGPSRLDQLLDALGDSGVDVLDVRPVLLDARRADREDDFVYYERGTHWQARGALAALRAIVEHLRTRFPGIEPLPPEAFEEDVRYHERDNEARAMYIADLLPQVDRRFLLRDPRHRLVRTAAAPARRWTESEGGGPPAILLHDSFAGFLQEASAEVFARLVMVWSYELDPGLLEEERPELVVEMMAERALFAMDPERQAGEHSAEDPVADRFRAARRIVFSSDPDRLTEQFTPLMRARVRSERDTSGGYLLVMSQGKPDSIALPVCEFPRGARVFVRVDIEAPKPTAMEIYYRRATDGTFSPERAVTVPLATGFNRCYVEIDQGPLTDRLIVCPGEARGHYKIRHVEVRAESAY